MRKELEAFKIKIGNRILDYRLGQKLDLNKIISFFEKKYKVKKIWSGDRHILGILEKFQKEYFLKLSTSEGISFFGKREYKWNEIFNNKISHSEFQVPRNLESGYFEKLFYQITEKFDGELLCDRVASKDQSNRIIDDIEKIISLSRLIESIKVDNLEYPVSKVEDNFRNYFIAKTKSWYKSIPLEIAKKFDVLSLLELVESDSIKLSKKPRHGDFAPWHIFRLSNNKLGLIDGEHFLSQGVAGYDIGYFLQRGFSVLKNSDVSQMILNHLIKYGYDLQKLKVILAARAIGGYLDESLAPLPNYDYAVRFQNWIMHLKA